MEISSEVIGPGLFPAGLTTGGQPLRVEQYPPNPFGLNELAAALARAQGMMANAKKDAFNPHFKNNYADLASVWDVIREPLSANGLAVVQLPTTDKTGVKVTTTLIHKSGQSISAECWLPVAQATPQGYGSAITYARRYSLSAIVGVATEDDDGQLSTVSSKSQATVERERRQAAKAEAERTPAKVVELEVPKAPDVRARAARLFKQAEAKGMTQGGFRDWVALTLGSPTSSDKLTAADMDLLESTWKGTAA